MDRFLAGIRNGVSISLILWAMPLMLYFRYWG